MAKFTAAEVRSTNALCGVELPPPRRHRAMVSMGSMEVVVDVATKATRTVKPRAGADEDVAAKPFRAVVAGGGAGVRRHIVIAIRALRSHTDIDTDLGLCCGCK